LTAFIIEDHEGAQAHLEALLKLHFPQMELVGSAGNVNKAIEALGAFQPDLVFMDVELHDETAFDLLKRLPNIKSKLIFTTGHQGYAINAINAIKHNALDYLLKPIDAEELVTAVRKAEQSFEKDTLTSQVQHLLSNIPQASTKQTILLKDKYGAEITQIDQIIRLKAEGSYTRFYLTDGRSLLVTGFLKEHESTLPEEQFFRCHYSHLVNLDHLLRYDKKEGDFLIMKDGEKVPLASRKKDALMAKLNQLG
jgi:two-component system LytT family response regulator